MGSKFNSVTMLNKTPPVCQKHQPAPTLPIDTEFASINAWVNFNQPIVAPSEVWSIHTLLPLIGPGLFYRATPIDQSGRQWTIIAAFEAGYEEWQAAAFITLPPTPPTAFHFAPQPTWRAFPPDTRLWVAQGSSNCDNATWRFTA